MEVKNLNKDKESLLRAVVFETSISFKARFLYVYILLHHKGWEFHYETVAEELGCTVTTLRAYMAELVLKGLVVIEKQCRNAATGQFKESKIILPKI